VARIWFRPMTEDDFALMERWLRQDHVQRWWRDPTAADRVAEKYGPRIRGDHPVQMCVVLWDDRPIGFIQRYRTADDPDFARAIAPSGLRFESAGGIDYAIGEPALVGRGIGSRMVTTFSASTFEHYPDIDAIVVTPQARNHASCRALEKAGYGLAWTGLLDSDHPSDAGPATLYVLQRSP
jgi:aminoglycoside 6'-N-acetyltransferase